MCLLYIFLLFFHSCGRYLEAQGSLPKVSFDLSLARGLDYYTGVIYEFVFCGDGPAVGSIAAGGRYDRLIGMFSGADCDVPCVGVSVGIERVFAIKEAQRMEASKAGNARSLTTVNVYVASIPGEGMLEERMRVCAQLWKAGISTEYSYSPTMKFKK